VNPKRKQVQCDIEVPDGAKRGEFANAFRILPDGAEFLLDFLVYSEQEDSAIVVARLRVNPGLLGAIQDQLGGLRQEAGLPIRQVFLARGNEEVH